MTTPDTRPAELTLDPDDWGALRALGHRMVDDMMDYLEGVRNRPAWQPIPEDVRQTLQAPLPVDPTDPAKVYALFREAILPHPTGNIHPRFWGWVMGTGTPEGMLAEMLAAGMNPNLGGGDHVPVYVESQVLDWCKHMLGYPADASGLLVSGGSMANLVGLTVARNTRAAFPAREKGLRAGGHQLTLYSSKETHSSNLKAAELLGLGREALRLIRTDRQFRVDVEALEAAILADRAAGHQPFCVVGNAGTVNTGAFDDLQALADLCAREGLWFHVDGAFGALAALSPELKPLVAGMERADSVAFDMHKWMYMPIEIGCALVRREREHREAFSLTPDYLTHADRGLAGGASWFSDYGVQLSRGFRALKAWFSLMTHGVDRYRRLIEQNVEQAQFLAERVDAERELQRLAPAPLNIVCFRFLAPNLDDHALNRLNEELLLRMHESGLAVPSSTTLDGRYALRVAITNHRSRREDFDLLVRETLRLGRDLTAEIDAEG